MMRVRHLAIVLAVLAFAVTARGDGTTSLSQTAVDALTAIDQSPTNTPSFVLAFDGSGSAVHEPRDDRARRADDRSGRAAARDPGADAVHVPPTAAAARTTTLVADRSTVAANADAPSGSPVLILRAAIESLGALAAGGGHAQPGDAALLVSHLDDESRDVRATTARALGELCDTTAIDPLRAARRWRPCRRSSSAISEALRVLDTCTPS